MSAKVLIAGSDEMLLYTRSHILCRSYKTITCFPEKAVERLDNENFDLLLVCVSVPYEDGAALIEEVHMRFPSLPIVRLISESWPRRPKPGAAKEVVADFRPLMWVQAVDEILSATSASAG